MGVKELLSKAKVFVREHYLVLILLLLSLSFFYSIISSDKTLNNVHYINDVTFYSYNMKKALSEGTLPLWTPYYYSGRPLFAQPEYHFIDLNFILIMLTGNIYLAMNYSVIFYFFLAGVGAYLVSKLFIDDKKGAFLA